MTSTRKYREIEGMRAFAALSVVLAHAHNNIDHLFSKDFYNLFFGYMNFGVGIYGVDIFFAISGFLITGIIADDGHAGNFLRWFYLRRALRILPLAFAGIFLAWLLAVIFREVGDAPQLLTYLLYIGNYNALGESIDPALTVAKECLLHYWSLAIEEQYYVVWPLLLLVFAKARARVTLALVAIAISLSIRAGFDRLLPDLQIFHFGYYLTAARMDGLAAGALVAIGLRAWHRGVVLWIARGTLVAGLAYAAHGLVIRSPDVLSYAVGVYAACAVVELVARAVVSAWSGPTRRSATLFESQSWLYPLHFVVGFCALDVNGGGWPISHFAASAMAAAVIAVMLDRPALTNWLFSNRVIVYLGSISYGIYVYHAILFDFTPEILPLLPIDLNQGDLWLVAGRTGLVLGIAALSWHCFEKPILDLKYRYPLAPPRSAWMPNRAAAVAFAATMLIVPPVLLLRSMNFTPPESERAGGLTTPAIASVTDNGHYAVNISNEHYAPTNLFDGNPQTCWHSPPKDGATVYGIHVTFAHPERITAVRVPGGPVPSMRPNVMTVAGLTSDGQRVACGRIVGIAFAGSDPTFGLSCADKPLAAIDLSFDETSRRYVLQCEIALLGPGP